MKSDSEYDKLLKDFKKFKGLLSMPDFNVSLRDYFAGQFISGIYYHSIFVESAPNFCPRDVARDAYELADAMLEERNKGE